MHWSSDHHTQDWVMTLLWQVPGVTDLLANFGSEMSFFGGLLCHICLTGWDLGWQGWGAGWFSLDLDQVTKASPLILHLSWPTILRWPHHLSAYSSNPDLGIQATKWCLISALHLLMLGVTIPLNWQAPGWQCHSNVGWHLSEFPQMTVLLNSYFSWPMNNKT